ncbi:MAG: hypothetical protein ABJ215_11125 [Alphaproteobacteria bacterium]
MTRLSRAFFTFVFVATILIGAPTTHAGEVLRKPPEQPDPTAKYLFYMRGRHVERAGAHGESNYPGALDALADKGLIVIGEVRLDTNPGQYARKIAAQVNGMLQAGVPARNITVSGFSRGGFMTLLTSSFVENDGIKYAVMAGCGAKGTEFRRSYEQFSKRRAKLMRGHFFVAWDRTDTSAGDCDLALNAADAVYRNQVYNAGAGHRLFYKPHPLWIDPLAAFALSD